MVVNYMLLGVNKNTSPGRQIREENHYHRQTWWVDECLSIVKSLLRRRDYIFIENKWIFAESSSDKRTCGYKMLLYGNATDNYDMVIIRALLIKASLCTSNQLDVKALFIVRYIFSIAASEIYEK